MQCWLTWEQRGKKQVNLRPGPSSRGKDLLGQPHIKWPGRSHGHPQSADAVEDGIPKHRDFFPASDSLSVPKRSFIPSLILIIFSEISGFASLY